MASKLPKAETWVQREKRLASSKTTNPKYKKVKVKTKTGKKTTVYKLRSKSIWRSKVR